jgi:hypothetical protein
MERMRRLNMLFSDDMGYGVAVGPPATRADTGGPTPTIGIRFVDQVTLDSAEAILAADNARDLAMKILDTLKQTSSVPVFPAGSLPPDGRPK